MTFAVTTEADTRSKSRQTRTWTIEADTEDDAVYEARMRHYAVAGWNCSVWVAWVESAFGEGVET